jgi:hypothetical protein
MHFGRSRGARQHDKPSRHDQLRDMRMPAVVVDCAAAEAVEWCRRSRAGRLAALKDGGKFAIAEKRDHRRTQLVAGLLPHFQIDPQAQQVTFQRALQRSQLPIERIDVLEQQHLGVLDPISRQIVRNDRLDPSQRCRGKCWPTRRFL